MQPVEAPHCDIRNSLRSDLRVRMAAYREAIADLENLILKAHKGPPYDQVIERARQARDKFEEVRHRFEQHVAEHGCGSL